METLRHLGTLVLFVVVTSLAHCIVATAVCPALRIRLTQVQVFFGQPVLSRETPWGTLSLGTWPTGGFVGFDEEALARRPFLVRWLPGFCSIFSALALAVLCLGWSQAGAQYLRAFPQILDGLFHPMDKALPLVAAFFQAEGSSLVLGLGIWAAKTAAFNTLPIAGNPLASLAMAAAGRESALARRIEGVSVAFVFALLGCWGAAFTVWLWRQAAP